jgi:predicted site-specific integrase-resolvase
VIVDYNPSLPLQMKGNAAIYARVSSAENKDNLERQAERLQAYAIARGYQVQHVVKETGSGLNDNRKKLARLLEKEDYEVLIVEHRDRLCRFGSNYIDILLKRCNVTLDIVNKVDDKRDDLMTDLVAIITSFAARLYGQRRGKRKTEKIIATLQSENDCEEISKPSQV